MVVTCNELLSILSPGHIIHYWVIYGGCEILARVLYTYMLWSQKFMLGCVCTILLSRFQFKIKKSQTRAEGRGAFYQSHGNVNFTIIANQSPLLLLLSQKTNKHPNGLNEYPCMEVTPQPKIDDSVKEAQAYCRSFLDSLHQLSVIHLQDLQRCMII